jgi:5-hydroxyisourate hydrolase-like protein (transthyretin family)
LPEDAQVSVKIYNVIGQLAAKIISADHFEKSGTHQLKVENAQFPFASGVYFIKFTAGDFSKVMKMVKAKK